MMMTLQRRFDEAVAEVRRSRAMFDAPRLRKMFSYPPQVSAADLVFALFPGLRRRWIVENRLFWGDPFYTQGYFMDYYRCGLIAEETELRTARYLLREMKPDDSFFDVGAHYGFFAVLAAAILRERAAGPGPARPRVHAFEPMPETFRLLCRNVSGKLVAAHECALFGEEGDFSMTAFEACDKSGSDSLYGDLAIRQQGARGTRRLSVHAETLDRFCRREDVVPTMMKVDVEGAEFDVFSGGRQVLRERHPTILMEMWPREYNARHMMALDLLAGFGYRFHRLDEDSRPVAAGREVLAGLPAVENIVCL